MLLVFICRRVRLTVVVTTDVKIVATTVNDVTIVVMTVTDVTIAASDARRIINPRARQCTSMAMDLAPY